MADLKQDHRPSAPLGQTSREPSKRTPPSLDDLNQVSQTGWSGFTRFMLVTLIGVIVALLVIAAFTVWS